MPQDSQISFGLAGRAGHFGSPEVCLWADAVQTTVGSPAMKHRPVLQAAAAWRRDHFCVTVACKEGLKRHALWNAKAFWKRPVFQRSPCDLWCFQNPGCPGLHLSASDIFLCSFLSLDSILKTIVLKNEMDGWHRKETPQGELLAKDGRGPWIVLEALLLQPLRTHVGSGRRW